MVSLTGFVVALFVVALFVVALFVVSCDVALVTYNSLPVKCSMIKRNEQSCLVQRCREYLILNLHGFHCSMNNLIRLGT